MRLPKRGEKGFTLIELLIVVAILGVLAAVVIPNVGRFIGRGETEAGETELSNVQAAVVAMMVDNQLSSLPTAVNVTATKNMSMFPDTTTNTSKSPDADGDNFTASDGGGYVLYQHDINADGANTSLVNYTATQFTKGTYICDASGTVTQVTTGYE
ncbi:MAG: type II secretion system protein [Chloroflexi bacterium]|nr:type II secretion system protein [Chloroflexota bacterium]